MYIVLLTYTAAIEEVDYTLPDHAEWLGRQFELGRFLAAGKRNPPTGRVIITRPMPRGKLDAILATDPFCISHLARYEVVEFSATRTASEMLTLNEATAH
jgi:uncharacterized protein YciI